MSTWKNIPKQLGVVSVVVSVMVASSTVFASGFQIFEQGTSIIGRAGVGQAVVKDASSSYFNPAGMTQICDTELQLASQLFISKTRFSPNTNNTFSGNDGKNAGALLPGFTFYAVTSYNEDLKFGFSVTSPFGGLLSYNDGWVGRYFIQSTSLITMDFTPSVAYQLNDYLSVGFGIFVEYAKLKDKLAIPGPLGIADGQAELPLHHTGAGVNLGLLWCITDDTKLGLAYRSPIKHRLDGDSTFLRLATTPTTTSVIHLPQSVIASFSQEFCQDFVLLAELGWVNWHVFQSTPIQIQGVTLDIPRNWKNTYRAGVAGQYRILPELMYQLGISYDSSPTDINKRLPDLPMDKQIRVGTGLVYNPCKNITLGLSYEYINFGKAPINKTTGIGTLAGDYRKNYGQVLAMNVNVGF